MKLVFLPMRVLLFILLFCSGAVSAVQVSLLDTSTFARDSRKTDLGWDRVALNPMDDARGFDEESWIDGGGNANERAFVSCSAGQAHADNWVFTPVIERKEAQVVYLRLHYNLRDCTNIETDSFPACRETFSIHTMQYTRSVPDSAINEQLFNATRREWTHLSSVVMGPPLKDKDYAETTVSLALNKNTKSFRFAFQENGACVSLLRFQFYYTSCPEKVSERFVRFENTVTVNSTDGMTKRNGQCVPQSAPRDEQLIGFCSAQGEWTHMIGSCECLPGFTSAIRNNQPSCRACPLHSYKSERGDGPCQTCPEFSETVDIGSDSCKCLDGYLRAPGESAAYACTRIPGLPEKVKVATVDQNSAIVTWDEPPYLGGREELWYEWECLPDPMCVNVTATPADERIYNTRVRFSGMNPNTTYHFRIHSKNKLSQKGYRETYRLLDLTTLPLSPDRASDLRVEVEQIDGITLAWKPPMLVSAKVQYELEINPPVDGRSKVQTSKNYHTLLNLIRGVRYSFRVRANANGWSDWTPQLIYELGKGQMFEMLPTEPPRTYGTVQWWMVAIFFVFIMAVAVLTVVFCKRKEKTGKQLSDLDILDTYKQDSMTPDFNSTQQHFGDAFRSNKLNAPLIGTLPPPYHYGGTPVSKYKPYVDPTAYEDPNQALTEFTFDIDPSAVFITQVIGGGEFGDVCKGGLKKNLVHASSNISLDHDVETVAIKTLKPGSGPKAKADFLLEASIMGQFAHKNVVRLIGVVTRAEPVMIVTEYMCNGSLDHFLRTRDTSEGMLSWPQLVEMLKGIASGMKYLTDKGYVHRDVAARNVLVGADYVCKIADFGLSRGVEDNAEQEYTTNGGKIPVRWTAPEAITHRKFAASSDVWSFGVLTWEVCSFGERPYWDWTNQQVISEIMSGYRLPAPMDCPPALYKLMTWCWRLDRRERPSFAQIVANLEKYSNNTDLLFVDTPIGRTNHSASATNINSAYGVVNTPYVQAPPLPGVPPTLPPLDEFLRTNALGHCYERLAAHGIKSMSELMTKSHLDLLACGLISDDYQRIRDALRYVTSPRTTSRPVFNVLASTMPTRRGAHDTGFFV